MRDVEACSDWALAGLPPYAAVAIAVTLLLAALQALAGIWLATAVFPRQLRLPFPRRGRGRPGAPRIRQILSREYGSGVTVGRR